jgi:3',5'-cyclic AMP phosphodiesterase CpdA
VVVLGDPHLPGKYLAQKERVLQAVNGWADADLVAVVGDICEDLGTAEEYAAVRRFFDRLTKPAIFMAGNHDYIYADHKDAAGRRLKGTVDQRTAKLERFRATFGLREVFSSRRLGGYLLVFLSTDDLTTGFLTKISERQLAWLRAELEANPALPTVIFFHGPLEGTLLNYNLNANRDNYIAQPAYELKRLLRNHPQVFLWVAGHMHVPATNESFRHPINLYDGRVWAVHATDLQRERIWTTSLFLHPDKAVVKTYDHQAGQWMPDLERSHPIPRP